MGNIFSGGVIVIWIVVGLLIAAIVAGCMAESHRDDAMSGDAIAYSDDMIGITTASGQTYNPTLYTAAHDSLEFGTIIRVYTDDGRSCMVTVNDRLLTKTPNHILNVSHRAADKLGIVNGSALAVKFEKLVKR